MIVIEDDERKRNMFSDLREDFYWYAAKSGRDDRHWLPVWMHAKDTGEVMGWLAEHWLPWNVVVFLQENGVPDVVKCARFLGYVHDIGKMTNSFQCKISHAVFGLWTDCMDHGSKLDGRVDVRRVPHNLAGECLLRQFGVSDSLAEIVGSHHGRPADLSFDVYGICGNPRNSKDMIEKQRDFVGNIEDKPSVSVWHKSWTHFLKWVFAETGYSKDTLPEPTVSARIILSGLLVMADWIASNFSYFLPVPIGFYDVKGDYQERIEKGLSRLHLPERLTGNQEYDMLAGGFSRRFGFDPNAVQQMMIQAVDSCEQPGLFILEAPMGCGKTEASLAAADMMTDSYPECGGVYFGLPTQATANGIFPRVEAWAETKSPFTQQSIKLAHGNASLNDTYRELFEGIGYVGESELDSLLVHEFFEGRKQSLLADFVVATIDQVLFAGLKQKHFMLRHLGLAGKVVIIDEVHSYDSYMMEFLSTVLTWLGVYRVPVILLSATLPYSRRESLVRAYLGLHSSQQPQSQVADWMKTDAYPVLTYTDGLKVCQSVCSLQTLRHLDVDVHRIDETKLVSFLQEKLKGGGCAAVIVNTVRYAQKIASLVFDVYEDAVVLVAHASFIAEHRVAREAEILQKLGKKSREKDRYRVILVGTQVLEQSLDYDVDVMVSQLCPMDLLLQRMGRLFRHKEHDGMRPVSCQFPEFFILHPDDVRDEQVSCYMYSSYLLKETQKVLPDCVHIPDDISSLVQAVYRQKDVAEQTNDYRVWYQSLIDAANKAFGSCLLYQRGMRSCHGLLDKDVVQSGDGYAEMAVRNSGGSVVPICLQQQTDGTFVTLVSGHVFDVLSGLSSDDIRCLLKQKISLPHVFVSNSDVMDRTIADLEEQTSCYFPNGSQNVKVLKQELFLVFDEKGDAVLCDKRIHYDRNLGLIVERSKS